MLYFDPRKKQPETEFAAASAEEGHRDKLQAFLRRYRDRRELSKKMLSVEQKPNNIVLFESGVAAKQGILDDQAETVFMFFEHFLQQTFELSVPRKFSKRDKHAALTRALEQIRQLNQISDVFVG